MNDKPPTTLDDRRGMAAQKATELRREVADFRERDAVLREREADLEHRLLAAPAENWPAAVEKARYLLTLFGHTLEAQDARRKQLIAAVLADFDRLLPTMAETGDPAQPSNDDSQR
jgi:hypothetical protein